MPSAVSTGSRAASKPRRRALVGLAAVALALGAVEVAARVLVAPPRYVDGMDLDPRRGSLTPADLRLTTEDERGPFLFRTNSLGFRGAELPAPDALPSGRRVLFVGDSFVNAWGIREEDTLTERVAAGLGSPESPVTAFNISSNDIGTAQELLFWREHGRALDPDLVVLVMFPGNDVLNNAIGLAGRSKVSPGDYVRPYLVPTDDGGWRTRFVHPTRAVLRRHSAAFRWLEHELVMLGTQRDVAWLKAFPDPPGERERTAAGHAPHAFLEIFCKHAANPAWDTAWETTERLLTTFRDEVEAEGSRFLLVVVPFVFQVQLDGIHEFEALRCALVTGTPLDQLVDWNLPERRLERFCEDAGIDALFLLEPLRREAARAPGSVYLNDGHLTSAGHAVAAAEIVRRLSDPESRNDEAAWSEPAPWLAPAGEAAANVDLRVDGPVANLGGGWSDWRAGWNGTGPGRAAITDPTAHLVLPARAGDLVLRGALPASVPLPHHLALGLVIGKPTDFELTQTGPFELRVPAPLPDWTLPPAYEGYVPIVLHGRTPFRMGAGDTRPIGAIVHEVGFD